MPIVVNLQYERVRGEAKELLDTAKEQYSQLDPALVPEFQEVNTRSEYFACIRLDQVSVSLTPFIFSVDCLTRGK